MGNYEVLQQEFEHLIRETEQISQDAECYIQYCHARKKLLDSLIHLESLN